LQRNSDCGDFQTLYTARMKQFSPPDRTIVLIGLMGVGKTTVGRRLATLLERPFMDADEEIETAAGRSVSEIFEDFGEAAFREGERKVIARLLDQPPMVLALGGGAFIDPETRSRIKDGACSVWLKADIDTLMKRVTRRNTRPLLQTEDPETVMRDLLEKRSAVYAEADVHVNAAANSHQATVDAILDGLSDWENAQ
jgi:shikimate kinase